MMVAPLRRHDGNVTHVAVLDMPTSEAIHISGCERTSNSGITALLCHRHTEISADNEATTNKIVTK